MKLGNIVALAMAVAGLLAVREMPARAEPYSCTGSDCTFTGAGGSSSDPTLLPVLPPGDVYDAIDIVSSGGDQYFEFFFTGGPNITIYFDFSEETSGSESVFFTDPAGDSSTNTESGTIPSGSSLALDISLLPAFSPGDYIVGFTGALTPTDAGTLNISPSFYGIPEPATLALFAGALAGFGLFRYRRRRSA